MSLYGSSHCPQYCPAGDCGPADVIKVAAITAEFPARCRKLSKGIALERIYPAGFSRINFVSQAGRFPVFGGAHPGNAASSVDADQ